jgi:hypothetical protein
VRSQIKWFKLARGIKAKGHKTRARCSVIGKKEWLYLIDF